MSNIHDTETPEERKRRADRERIAHKRAAMTPDERAAARRENDRIYRETHRAERQSYDRERRELRARQSVGTHGQATA